MAISVVCSCGKKLNVGDHLAGKRVKCPSCGGAVAVSAPVPVSKNGARAAGSSTSRKAFGTGSGSTRAAQLASCARCQGKFPPETLVKLRGQMICKPCKELALMERPTTAEKNRKVLIWSGIAGGIGLVIVVGLGIYLAVRMAAKPGAKTQPPAVELASAPQARQPVPPNQPPAFRGDASKTPGKVEPVPVRSPSSAATAGQRELRHEPKSGTLWLFHLDVALEPSAAKDAKEGNRITGDLELVQKESGADFQALALVFRKLEVAKPFTDADYRGAESFPKNVLGKGMTLLLGPQKGAEQLPEAWPAGFPYLADTGAEIQHDDTKDPAGLAFKKYLTEHGNDALAQAFLFLGRDLLPTKLGNPSSWERTWPYLMECKARAPITYTMSRPRTPAGGVVSIGIKSKGEHSHKAPDGKVLANLKAAGTGTWKYNLDDSMTEALQYSASIVEEAVEQGTRDAYTFRLALTRQKVHPGDLAKGDAPAKPPPEDMPAKKPEAAKKPAAPPMAPIIDAKPVEKNAKPEKKDAPPTPANKPKPDAAPGKEPPKPAAEDSNEVKERMAQSKLKLARQFIELGKPEDAIDYCKQILKRWPGTKAAEEAEGLLKKLMK